jgi:hypothetical protein
LLYNQRKKLTVLTVVDFVLDSSVSSQSEFRQNSGYGWMEFSDSKFHMNSRFDYSTNSSERERVGGAPKWAKEEILKRERERVAS